MLSPLDNKNCIDCDLAARLMGITSRTVRRMIADGRIRAETIPCIGGKGGETYRIPLSSLPAEAQIKYLCEASAREPGDLNLDFDLAGYKAQKGEAGMKILLQRQEAVLRLRSLQSSRGKNLTQRVDDLAAEYGVSSMTLRRWAKAFAEEGLGGLVRSGRNDKGKSRCMCMEARRFICEQYLSPAKRTQALILDKLADRVRDLGPSACDDCPYNPESENHLALIGTEDEVFYPACDQAGEGIRMDGGRDAVRRVVESISEEEKTYMRQGRKAWEAKYMVKGTRKKPDMVNEAWFGDHHQFDLFVLDERGRPVRPWLTVWYDIGSGCIAGWCISLNPNSKTIVQAFARGAAEKANNPICGIPRYCYIDNGKDYRGKRFEGGVIRDYTLTGLNANLNGQGLMQVLGIEVKHAKPYHGWAKPVERWFRTLEERYCRDLPGYCAGKPEDRPENFEWSLAKMAEEGALLSLDELGNIFVNEILPAYHNKPHEGYNGEAPAERYARLPKARSERVGWNVLAIYRDDEAKRTVSTQGIKLDGQLYWHDDLRHLVRQEVTLRYDRDDCRSASVFDREGRFVCEVEPKALMSMVGEDESVLSRHMGVQKLQEKEVRRTVYSRGVKTPGKRSGGNVYYEIVDERSKGTLTNFEAERAARSRADVREKQRKRKEHIDGGSNAVRGMFRAAGESLLRNAK